MSDDVKQELRNWDGMRCPYVLRLLIVKMLMQMVHDADAIARRGKWDYDTGFKAENVPFIKDRLKHWMRNSRFEFWTACIDIPPEAAEQVITEILEGERDVSGIYRSDKK